MPKPLKERDVQTAIRDHLFSTGWGRNYKDKSLKEQGVDIQVRHNKYARYFLIETKGESTAKSAKSQRETAFVYSLGQIITRMESPDARYYYGLGLPVASANIARRRIPWKLAKKLLLYVFSVDRNRKVTRFSWKEMKEVQEK